MHARRILTIDCWIYFVRRKILIRYAIAESVVDQTSMKKMRYPVKKVTFCDVSPNVPFLRQKQQLKHG